MSKSKQHTQETKIRLMESAKKEFLAYGFEKASLRTICKNAELTTGAVYFFFQDKDELFCTLTQDSAKALIGIIQKHIDMEKEMYEKFGDKIADNMEKDLEFARSFVTYAYEHRQECTLLFEKSKGSSREHFLDELIAMLEQSIHNMLMANVHVEEMPKVFNECTSHWFTHLQIEAFLHVLSHDMPLEEAMKQIEIMTEFLAGGYNSLLRKATS